MGRKGGKKRKAAIPAKVPVKVGGKTVRPDNLLVPSTDYRPVDNEKVRIEESLETKILEFLKTRDNTSLKLRKGKRLTFRSVEALYNQAVDLGFTSEHVEEGISLLVNKIGCCCELGDLLSWLCLAVPHEDLPHGFSDKNIYDHTKPAAKTSRPTFEGHQEDVAPAVPIEFEDCGEIAGGSVDVVDDATSSPPEVPPPECSTAEDSKRWILERDSTEEYSEESEETMMARLRGEPKRKKKEKPLKPEEVIPRFLAADFELDQAMTAAAIAKARGDKSLQRTTGRVIRDLKAEIAKLKQSKGWDRELVDVLMEKKKAEQAATAPPPKKVVASGGAAKKTKKKKQEDSDDDEAWAAHALDEMNDSTVTPAPPEVLEKTSQDKLYEARLPTSFTVPPGWSGKAPRGRLEEFCRKNGKQVPRFSKRQGSRYANQVAISGKDGSAPMVFVLPDVVAPRCSTKAESINFVSTMALYDLCKHTTMHNLLPPPFKEAWLLWVERDSAASLERDTITSKPRITFIHHLLEELEAKGVTGRVTDMEEQQCTDQAPLGAAKKGSDNDSDDSSCGWEALAGDTSSEDDRIDATEVGVDLRLACEERMGSDIYQEMEAQRRELPAWKHRNEIVNTVNRNRVTIVSGETGSGKTTQSPQFVLADALVSGSGDRCNIVCTQPRRITAVSVANRVAEEMASAPPGTPGSLVGYQIRLDSRCAPSARLVFCTTGVLLRRLTDDPTLASVSHVFVDEVHERSLQSDFLLVVLRDLLATRTNLHVVLMSATLDSDKMSSYFGGCPVVEMPGRTFPVSKIYLEEILESTGYVLDDDSEFAARNRTDDWQDMQVEVNGKTTDVSYSNAPMGSRVDRTLARWDHTRSNLEAIEEVIYYIDDNYRGVDGAVLVFVPGWSEIAGLCGRLSSDKQFIERHVVLPLHSQTRQEDQNGVFAPAPRGMRKVVVATNIAETGITIPDVVFVIDSGLVRETRYDARRRLTCLESVSVSRASAQQRAGRAGRVREGFCFRMYTREKHSKMREYAIPELLRASLEELCLHVKVTSAENPATFLARALDPPAELAVTSAMKVLHEVGAVDREGDITPLGTILARLPVDVKIGKMLLLGSVFRCTSAVTTIAAIMSHKSPFSSPLHRREEAAAAHRRFAVECEVGGSDLLAAQRVYDKWRRSNHKDARLMCKRFFLDEGALRAIHNLRERYEALLRSVGFPGGSQHARNDAMVTAVIAAGLFPSIVREEQTGLGQPSTFVEDKSQVWVHPSSINHQATHGSGWLAYHVKLKTKKTYLMDTTRVSPISLLLFGGDVAIDHVASCVKVAGWASIRISPKSAVVLSSLREELEMLFARKLEDTSFDLSSADALRVLSLVTDVLLGG